VSQPARRGASTAGFLIEHFNDGRLAARLSFPHIMTDDQAPPRPAGRARSPGRQRENRARATQAREAAEALFRPKPRDAEPPRPDATPQDHAARHPRVLSALTASPATDAMTETSATPQPEVPAAIPASEFTRIRAWVAYGLTVREVAEMYGVSIEDVQRILRQA
jgi:hypothetical protein